MPTTTTDPIATTPIKVRSLRDAQAPWWPQGIPPAVLELLPPTRPRFVALVRTLLEHRRELIALGHVEGSDFALVKSYLGTGFTALSLGVEGLDGHAPNIVEFFSRFVTDVDGDKQAEREAWSRARLDFGHNLKLNQQAAAVEAILNQFKLVGASLVTRRELLRAADEMLSWVETWLAGAGQAR